MTCRQKKSTLTPLRLGFSGKIENSLGKKNVFDNTQSAGFIIV